MRMMNPLRKKQAAPPDPVGMSASANAVSLVCAQVVHQVASGFWPGGYTLTEIELTDWFKVSRSTVRESLRRLESEGLVVKNRSRNLAVRRLSRRDVTELYELRELLEGYAAKRVAKQYKGLSEAEQRQLQGMLKDWQGQAQGQSAIPNALEANVVAGQDNRAFHSSLWQMSNNQHLPRLLGGTLMILFQSQFRLMLKSSDLMHAATDHVEILNSIVAGDEAQAERQMRRHIRASAQVVLSLGDESFS
jgi:DNA-binding GntR family transcriptional regulator